MNSARRIVVISCWRWDHNHFLDFLRLSLNPRWTRIWFVFFHLFVSIAKDITAPVDFSIPSPPVLHLAIWKSNGSQAHLIWWYTMIYPLNMAIVSVRKLFGASFFLAPRSQLALRLGKEIMKLRNGENYISVERSVFWSLQQVTPEKGG